MKKTALTPAVGLAVFVAALGYFVDAYDIMLYSIVRIPSLAGIGVPADRVLEVGVHLLNWQSAGLLLGGIFWGILGDKRGRLSVLFGSILLYSIANIANGFVDGVGAYSFWRFLAGLGLSGELGAGITLVSELLSRENRGWGTTLIATTGVTGVVVASLVCQNFDWRTAYFVGGGMGLVLLVLRLGVQESGLFKALEKKKKASRGDLLGFLLDWKKSSIFLSFILTALPVWYIVGVLLTLCPEIGKGMGMNELPVPGRAIFFAYLGLTTGDFTSGTLSQLLKNRKKVIASFLFLNCISITAYLLFGGTSLTVFYAICACMGFSAGFWAVAITSAAEQFGTNIRSTVTTTGPNFVRGLAIPLTLAFKALVPVWGALGSAAALGVLVMGVAFLALRNLKETYGIDLDFLD
jgi:MFS family permease